MSKLIGILGAAAALVACAAAGAPQSSAHVAAATPIAHADALCEVRATHTGHGVSLTGFVKAGAPVSGDYAFTITKSGGGGSSDVSQEGPVTLRSGASATVGSAEIGTGAGARWKAELIVRDASGVVCRDTRSSR